MCKQVAYDVAQKLSLYTVTKVSYSTVCGRDCNAVTAARTRTFLSQCNKQQNMNVCFLIS